MDKAELIDILIDRYGCHSREYSERTATAILEKLPRADWEKEETIPEHTTSYQGFYFPARPFAGKKVLIQITEVK